MPISPQARRCEWPFWSIAQVTTILRELGVRSFFREPREVSPHRLRQQLLQLAVFILERLQLAGVGYLHAGVLRTPRVERRVADPVLAAQLNDRDARLVLLQHLDDLLLAEPSLAHSSVSSRRILASKRGRSRGHGQFLPNFLRYRLCRYTIPKKFTIGLKPACQRRQGGRRAGVLIVSRLRKNLPLPRQASTPP